MTSNTDSFWAKVVRRLQREKGYQPLTPVEAQAKLDSAPEVQITEEEVESIVRGVISGKAITPRVDEDPSADSLETDGVQEAILQLNRDRGESDPETDCVLEDLRRKALEEDEEEDQDDEDKEQTGMDDGSKPPREGGGMCS